MKKKKSTVISLIVVLVILVAAGAGLLYWAAQKNPGAPAESGKLETTEAVESTETAGTTESAETAEVTDAAGSAEAKETVESGEAAEQASVETAGKVESEDVSTASVVVAEEAAVSGHLNMTISQRQFAGHDIDDFVSLTFVKRPTGTVPYPCDVSREKNGSIMAWTLPSEEVEGKLDLYIGSNAVILLEDGLRFNSFRELKRIRFDCPVDTSEITSMDRCFALPKLEEVDISGLDLSHVSSLIQLFGGCNQLKSLNLSGVTLSDATEVSSMFFGCSQLTELDLSGWDLSKVTDLSHMFMNCGSLTDVKLADWDVSHVTSFYSMFSGCTALKRIDLSGWDMSAAENLQNLFAGCTALEEVKLDGSRLGSVTNAGCMFYGCEKLAHLDVADWAFAPNCVTRRMLHGCQSLDNAEEAAAALKLPKEPTAADFTDPLTDMTEAEREYLFQLQFSGFDIPYRPEGDIGQVFSRYADLDLDKDGKRDQFQFADSTLELHQGNGAVTKIDLDFSYLGAGCSAGLFFGDINGTGKDDILAVTVVHSTAGNLLNFALYTDSAGRYYRQQLPKVNFYLEDLHNDYVRLSCSSFPYREVLPMDNLDFYPNLEAGVSLFDHFFGSTAVNGKTDDCVIRNILIDGRKLVVMYDFLQKAMGPVTSTPFGVVWRLERGGYFVIERMGTSVLRDYWLNKES